MMRSLNAIPTLLLLVLLPGAGLLAQERVIPFLGGGLWPWAPATWPMIPTPVG